MKRTRIGIIGAGSMGAAIIRGLAKTPGRQVMVAEQDTAKRRQLQRRFGVGTGSIQQLTKDCSAIIICVKPQDLDTVFAELRRNIRPGATVISIAAGISTAYLQRGCGPGITVVRVMPNLPGQVGEGISAFCLGKGAGNAQRRLTKQLFAGLGETIEVREVHMDAVTAISGSGPGFIAYLIQCLIDAGRNAGLSPVTAEHLVLKTLLGTALILTQQKIAPQELVRRVASPGGTTEAGLAKLRQHRVPAIMQAVVAAAMGRAKQLRRR